MNELYFKDNFTKNGENVDLEINNLTVGCITSKNNKFSLDVDGNLCVKSITVSEGSNNSTDLDKIYPVGSIYMNVTNTNPNALFGGSWQQIKDRFLLGCGDYFGNGGMGGEANHTLSVNEIPSHNHAGIYDESGELIQDYSFQKGTNGCALSKYRRDSYSTAHVGNTGGSQAHNNMPPYLSVYIWKRVS